MPYQSTSPWTDDRIAILKDCIDKKMSAGDTAYRMGMNRNQVIGKANRIGLRFLSVEAKPKRAPGRTLFVRAVFPYRVATDPVMPAQPEKPPEFLGLTIFELTKFNCHFPEGDRAPYSFCGAITTEGPYCSHHKNLCYHRVNQDIRRTYI